jgi:hypothetical protein
LATAPSVERTFANFQIFFQARDIERRNDSTIGSIGYSNAATTAPPDLTTAQLAVTRATHDADVIRLTAELAIAMRAASGNEPPPSPSVAALNVSPFDYSKPPVHYCLTHGTGYNTRHTSATCNACTTNPLHKVEATLIDKLGGSNWVASYTPPATA